MTEREVMINNEQVKLTSNFLSKIGLILLVSAIVLPLLTKPTLGVILYAIMSALFGLGLNGMAFWIIGKLR